MRAAIATGLAVGLAACATTNQGTVTMEDAAMTSNKVETVSMANATAVAPTEVSMITSAPDRMAMNAVIERATGKALMVPRTAFRETSRLTLQEPGAPGRDMRMPSDMVTHSFRLVSDAMGCALVYEATGEVFPLDGVNCR